MTQNSKYRTDFELSHQEIDRIVKEVSEILSEFHVERKTCLRARLLIEELLLGIMKSGDRPVTCRFSFIKKLLDGNFGMPLWDSLLPAARNSRYSTASIVRSLVGIQTAGECD